MFVRSIFHQIVMLYLYELHMSYVKSLFENCDVNDNFLICGDYNLPVITGKWICRMGP
jgi:hypothetical protein